MDKNKSIDGLTTRRSKTSQTRATSSAATTKKTNTSTKKPVKKNQPKSIKVTSPATDIEPPKTTPKPNSLQTPTPKPQTAPEPKATAADFLAPTQTFDFDEKTGELKAAKDQSMDEKNPHQTKKTRKNQKNQEPKKSKKPISKKRKIITGIILGIVILLIGAVIWFIIWGNDLLSKIGNGEGNIFSLFTEYYEPLKTDENGRTNILAFGTSGYDMEGNEGNGVHDGAQLTDSIMVISLDQETGDAAMLSLPRDLKVSRTCTATGKINEIYWCNNMDGEHEQEGAEALMAEVSDILGVDFQYYAHLNWGSLVSIVDILGGITVTLDEDIQDYNYTKAVFEAGFPYTINGAEALGLFEAARSLGNELFQQSVHAQPSKSGVER